MKVHVDNQFMVVSENDSVFILRWKKNTVHLTDEGFKKEARKFVDVVKREKSKRIMVDMREFHYSLSPELIIWRNQNVIAVYNEIGVEKFAFVGEGPTVQQNDPANTFVTKYFPTEQEVGKWLRS